MYPRCKGGKGVGVGFDMGKCDFLKMSPSSNAALYRKGLR